MEVKTSFGKWLGISNGKSMLADIFCEGVSEQQARAAVITYCLLFGIEVDTKEWDDLIRWIFDNYMSWDFRSIDDFDLYMSEVLV